jgi:hypothetical protein
MPAEEVITIGSLVLSPIEGLVIDTVVGGTGDIPARKIRIDLAKSGAEQHASSRRNSESRLNQTRFLISGGLFVASCSNVRQQRKRL